MLCLVIGSSRQGVFGRGCGTERIRITGCNSRDCKNGISRAGAMQIREHYDDKRFIFRATAEAGKARKFVKELKVFR